MRQRIRKSSAPEEFLPCIRADCRYRAPDGAANNCDYIAITGRSRINQHRVGERSPHKCRLYDAGERECVPIGGELLPGSIPHAVPKKRKAAVKDWTAARQMREAGASRAEIAAAMKCSLSTVNKWLKKEGLAKAPIDWERAWTLWSEGMTIERMARELGCCETAVNNWIARSGLRRRATHARAADGSGKKIGQEE